MKWTLGQRCIRESSCFLPQLAIPNVFLNSVFSVSLW
jgi:hypothetical protein